LQDSVQRLKDTEKELQQAIADDPDPEFSQAIEENKLVMYADVR
jgi:hypothetical protein